MHVYQEYGVWYIRIEWEGPRKEQKCGGRIYQAGEPLGEGKRLRQNYNYVVLLFRSTPPPPFSIPLDSRS